MLICVVYALLGFTAPASLGVGFTVLLATTYTLVGRSILVPSAFARTLWIGAFSAMPAILYFMTAGVPEGSAENPYIFTLFATMWCVFAVFAAGANSRQLYGLRAKIKEIGKLGQYTLEEKSSIAPRTRCCAGPLTCLAKEREDRPVSAAAVRASLLACIDAPKYDTAAASLWWQERRMMLATTTRPDGISGSAPTMAVDLRGRQRASDV